MAGWAFSLLSMVIRLLLSRLPEWEYARFTTVVDTNVSTGRIGLGYKF